MAERTVSMHAAYKSGKEIVDCFLARPNVQEARNAIVMIHGYRGLDDAQRAVTRQFAKEGFVCLSPDLFHGRVFTSPEECAFQKTSLDIPRAVEKIADSVPYLRRLPFVGGKKIALLGFCMGGGLALYALARSTAFAVGVIYHQSLFPDAEELQGIKAPLLCHYGTEDPITTKAEIELFKAALDRYHKKYEIQMYEGVGHAFVNNPHGRSKVNRRAAEESLRKTCKWLRKLFLSP